MFSEEVLHVCEEERWHTFDLQKIINEIHLRAAIDRFLQSLPLEKRFPLSLTPLSPRQIKHQSIFCNRPQKKRDNTVGVLEPRNCKKPTSSEQMKKLFDSGELARAESKNPAHLQRMTQFYLGLFFSCQGRENRRQLRPTILSLRKINKRVEQFEPRGSPLESSPAPKNHQGGLGDSEDESDASIFSVPNSETGQHSAPHIRLKLMPRQ